MQSLRYPLQRLEFNSDFLAINVIEYQPPGLGSSGGGIFNIQSGSQVNTSQNQRNVKGRILLPMPEGLSDSNSVNWTSDSLNSLQIAAVEAIDSVVRDNNLSIQNLGENGFSGVKDAAGDFFGKLGQAYEGLKDENTRNALRQYFSVQAANVFSANIDANSILGRTTGQILNPNMELLFRGVNLRMFSFNFVFTPRSQSEGQEVKAIINTFKRRMAPKTNTTNAGGQGIFIKSPDVFELQFRTGQREHPFLYKMKTCALKDMRVSYSNAGPYMTYEDGTPVSMTMTLVFQELNPIYAEDYTDNDTGVGF